MLNKIYLEQGVWGLAEKGHEGTFWSDGRFCILIVMVAA